MPAYSATPTDDVEDEHRDHARSRSWRKVPGASTRMCFVFAGLLLVMLGFGLRSLTQRLHWMNPKHFYSDVPLEILELGAVKWYHCHDTHVEGAECGVAV
jgi:hypothetical protein